MNNIPEGYKQTEVGVIPEDWDVKTLGEIGSFSKGQGVRKDQSQSGELPCIRYGELYTRHSNYIKQYYSFISKEIAAIAKKIALGDVLFAGSGETKEEIGKCAAFIDNIDAYAGGDIVILSPDNTNPLYLGYLLNSPIVVKQKASKGQGDAVVHISASNLKDVQIPVPPKIEEQNAIATVLSDTDALIERLGELIAKKIAIKQGAMQQLLTGEKRLPGFGGKWTTKKLKEVAEMYSGGTPLTSNNSYYGGQFPWVVIADMTRIKKYLVNTDKNITELGLENSSAKLFENGTLLFAMYASIGKCAIAKVDITCNQAILGINTKKIDTEFLYYYLAFNEQTFLQMGQAGTQNNLNKEIVQNLDIPYPSVEEQAAIATILSDMDSEIESLEQKRDKYKAIKQGMMQELLTGKTRLI